MKTFKQFRQEINEARKNPELNPKISAYEALLPYKDEENAYIHFSDLNKLGINPLSDFNTPSGIFAYPLKEIWKEYKVDKLKSFNALPFASDRKYIHLFKWNGKGKMINDLYKDYGSNKLDSDITKLKRIFDSKTDKTKTQPLFNKLLKLFIKWKIKIPDSVELGVPLNAGSFVGGSIDQFSADYNFAMKEILPLQKSYNESLIDFDVVVEAATAASKIKSPAGIFWTITMWLSNYGIDPRLDRFYNELLLTNYSHENKKVYKGLFQIVTYKDFPNVDSKTIYDGSRNWLHLFRALGYACIGDRMGKGLIHPSEPIQTVFFGKEFIESIDVVLNKDYKKPAKLERISTTAEAQDIIFEWEAIPNQLPETRFVKMCYDNDTFIMGLAKLIFSENMSPSKEDISNFCYGYENAEEIGELTAFINNYK